MNFKHVVLTALFCTSLLVSNTTYAHTNVTNSPSEILADGDYITHAVTQGETAYSIAKHYKVAVTELYKLNPSAEKGVKVGETLIISKSSTKPTSYIKHKIESKETLYGVSKKYGVPIDAIIKANSGLDSNSFKSGKTILIPIFDKTPAQEVPDQERHTIVEAPHAQAVPTPPSLVVYKVGKKETLYGISKAWGISIEDIKKSNPGLDENSLKSDMTIYLPKGGAEVVQANQAPAQILNKEIKVGVLLPFLSENGSVAKEKIVEYYEGILIAIQEMKAKGLNAEVFTFDIGEANNMARLESILETTEARSLSIIIGGISESQIKRISKFSKDNGINYVVPFGVVDSELNSNPYLFQATNSHSNLYPDVVKAFRANYDSKQCNFIFIDEKTETAKKKEDYIDMLKASLTKDKVPFRTTLLSSALSSNLEKLLVADSTKVNVIIPTSAAETTMRKLMPALSDISSDANISLFGFPEWQIYKSFYTSFHQYDTYIYSIFDFNDKQKGAEEFGVKYKQWFGRQLVNSYPRYSYLGYDTALYFLTALKNHGNNFAPKLSSVKVPTLQSSTLYEKADAKGGYINNGLYLIHYKTDSTIEKIECNRK